MTMRDAMMPGLREAAWHLRVSLRAPGRRRAGPTVSATRLLRTSRTREAAHAGDFPSPTPAWQALTDSEHTKRFTPRLHRKDCLQGFRTLRRACGPAM